MMVAIHSWPDFDDLPRSNEADLSKNEAEARYFEAEAKNLALRLEAVLASMS